MPRTAKTEPAILELLAQKHTLAGPEIVSGLAANGFRVNKTSVYRALERMLEKGQICRLSLGEQTVVYELRDHHHDHVVCQNCGKAETVECQVPQEPQITGFQIDHHHATYFGLCPDCQGSHAIIGQHETNSTQ